jgi:hypothetical protein
MQVLLSLNVATYKWKVHNGKIEYLLSQWFVLKSTLRCMSGYKAYISVLFHDLSPDFQQEYHCEWHYWSRKSLPFRDTCTQDRFLVEFVLWNLHFFVCRVCLAFCHCFIFTSLIYGLITLLVCGSNKITLSKAWSLYKPMQC